MGGAKKFLTSKRGGQKSLRISKGGARKVLFVKVQKYVYLYPRFNAFPRIFAAAKGGAEKVLPREKGGGQKSSQRARAHLATPPLDLIMNTP